jgi:predicted PurR-regulated permease PerM
MLDKFFTQRTLTVVGIVTFVVLAILLVVYAVDALLLAFAAILLAIFFRGLSSWLSERTGLGSTLSFVIVVAALTLILGVSIYFLEQSVVEQVGELREQLPNSINNIRSRLEQISWGRALLQQIPPSADIYNSIQNSGLLSRASGFFSTTVGIFVNFFIFIVLGIFIAIEPETYVRGSLLLVPKSNRNRAREILDALGETLRWWLVGKFCSMFAVGVMTWIGLYFLGVPLALTLGIITALFTFIPNFGPVLGLLPAVLLALSQDPIKAVYVVILYIVVQAIESNLITPAIERRTVSLPPALTIAVQLILSVFVGGLGLVLATPLVAVGIVLVQMLYIEDILGERVRTPDEKNETDEFVKKEESTIGVEKAKENDAPFDNAD